MRVEKPSPNIVFKLVLLLIIGVILMLALDNLIKVKSVSAPFVLPSSGQIQVEVVDGTTELPISGATVIIPELDRRYTTDENGKTKLIEVPILSNPNMQKVLPQSWGEVTIIVAHEGYIPYALFHAQIWPGEVRPGPRIYLLASGSTTNSQPFSVMEGPQRAWVNELVKKYSPAS